jgi:Clp amino terminal domain, pathogenicity island component
MFERYTEKARRVIFFSRYEASQFGSPKIDTEHLLLGLIREDKALYRWLPKTDIQTIRQRVDAHSIKRPPKSTAIALPARHRLHQRPRLAVHRVLHEILGASGFLRVLIFRHHLDPGYRLRRDVACNVLPTEPMPPARRSKLRLYEFGFALHIGPKRVPACRNFSPPSGFLCCYKNHARKMTISHLLDVSLHESWLQLNFAFG